MTGINIRIRFLVGRYHATPWDRHVNEGAVEWPPAPWRILRALAAGAWRAWPEGPPEPMTQAIDRLGQALPEYTLPPATFAHTRHYMPITEGSKQKTALVFDAFAATEKEAELIVSWTDVDLAPEMRSALRQACEHVSYLGRAESWAELELLDDHEVEHRHAWVASAADENADTVTLLACEPGEACWDSLQVVTSDLHAQRWSRAPGTRWVSYALDLPELQSRTSRTTGRGAAAMLFAVWSRVPVRVEDTVALAEMVRKRAVKASGDFRVHGHAGDGSPRQGHEHAYFIPYDDDGDTRIDHLLVYFPEEAPGEAVDQIVAAFDHWVDLTPWKGREDRDPKVRATRGERPSRAIRLTHLESWTHDELRREDEARKPTPLRSSTVWESRTPFVLTRHPKRHRDGRPKLDEHGEWVDGPWAQVQRELRNHGREATIKQHLPCDAAQGSAGGRSVTWERFRRKRRFGNGARVGSRGHGFRIVFDEPVAGPVALGYGSHFGLGLFMPVLPDPEGEEVNDRDRGSR